jgi:hypothetical protein
MPLTIPVSMGIIVITIRIIVIIIIGVRIVIVRVIVVVGRVVPVAPVRGAGGQGKNQTPGEQMAGPHGPHLPAFPGPWARRDAASPRRTQAVGSPTNFRMMAYAS